MIDKWDLRFLRLAKEFSTWSKDPSTKTGAVIVQPNRRGPWYGYNGFPGTMADKPEWYTNREEKYSRIIHCEMNALLNAEGSVRGCTLYTWPFASCDRCAVHMLQAGIVRFVFPKANDDLISRWGDSLERTKRYILECGATFTEVEEA